MNVLIYSFTPISIQYLMQTLDRIEATRGWDSVSHTLEKSYFSLSCIPESFESQT